MTIKIWASARVPLGEVWFVQPGRIETDGSITPPRILGKVTNLALASPAWPVDPNAPLSALPARTNPITEAV